MPRPVHLLAVVVIAGIAVLGLAAPGAAMATQPIQVAQDTSDFTFGSMHADYRLGLTPDGRSSMETTETIVARFPDIDQNRGIRRAIPTHYDGHPTELDVESVTDENGTARSFETEGEDEFLLVTIAADDYVHGAQTYVITYSQENVTLFPDDADDEEFYWEVNGTGWDQPFGEVSATLQVDAAIAPKLTGDVTCFQGTEASATECDGLNSETDADGWRVDATATDLAPHEGLTMVVGFEEGTFVPRDDSFAASPFPSIGLGGALAALAAAVVAGIARVTRWRNQPGRPTIIAEYQAPKGVNLLQAGDVSARPGKAMAAQFLSFAVRGNVRVLEAEDKNHYLLEFVHDDGLDQTELAILRALFPSLQPGTRRDLKKKNASLSKALHKQLTAAKSRLYADGLREKKGGALRVLLVVIAIFAGIVGFIASVIALGNEIGGVWPLLTLIGSILSAGIAVSMLASIRPLTAAGAELRDYLKGLKLYIELAEADRIRVLQSPEGALRSPYRPDPAASVAGDPAAVVDTQNPVQVLKLYEKVLPYAVLFGQEKKWAGVLGDYYAASGAEPEWYSGSTAFNAGMFAAGISTFSASTSSSWSGTATSSSSSGFSGGGSVGGGGGGGGGGGV